MSLSKPETPFQIFPDLLHDVRINYKPWLACIFSIAASQCQTQFDFDCLFMVILLSHIGQQGISLFFLIPLLCLHWTGRLGRRARRAAGAALGGVGSRETQRQQREKRVRG
jgi:hypothetical protein